MNRMRERVRAIVEGYFGTAVDEAVYGALELRELRGGEWLFRQGEAGDALYFLVRGRLQAWAEGAGGEGDPRLLGEVLPGDSVGEAGLLTGAPRSAGVRANRDSLLVRLEKADFERLAAAHPALVLKLASRVARLMQVNLSGEGGAQRGFSTVTLLALHESPRLERLQRRLSGKLAKAAGARVLTAASLRGRDAPEAAPAGESDSGVDTPGQGGLSEAQKQWLSDQENDYPLVLYLCSPASDAWSRFALRQADLVLLLADATEPPDPSTVELALKEAGVVPAGQLALALLQPAGREIEGTAAWLAPRRVDFHLHLREDREQDLERLVRLLRGRATGLVLGAGAVRGLAELGVYRAMTEAGIPVDWVGGSSIGSIVGAAVAHDWTPEHAIDMARESFVKGKPFSDYTIPVISLIRGRRMLRLLRSLVDVDIEDLPLPYFCISSKLDRGEVHVHERGSLVEAIRASAALPGVLPPAVVDSELVVDGAVLNNLPVDIMERRPVGTIIAVDVSFRHHRQVDYPETPSNWAVLRSRLLPFARRYRVPGLATLILRSTEIGTLVQSRERGNRADLLINPPVRQFGMTDVKAFDAIVEAGYQHAREELERWLAERGGLRELL